ncbi:hypothetical protein AB4Z01_11060 [Inquilinus sp. YAF38]|uniref:hypothetical protein n=1 Tax=Inquilinus sp. YAF38 TaxID=3233084 RepID=UPI003F922B88
MVKLLSPLSRELHSMRRKLDTRLSSRQPLSEAEVKRMIELLGSMEIEAAALESRPTVAVSEKTLDLARRLEAAGIVP